MHLRAYRVFFCGISGVNKFAILSAMSLLIEIRTAYFIAKLGTVSAAADALGVHRATVMRRIDLLEAELGL